MPTRSDFWKTHWDKKRADALKVRASGKAIVQWTPKSPRRLHVTCPFSEAFSLGAKELAGRWKKRSGTWTFSYASKRLVVELAERVFGKESVSVVGFPPD